MRYGENTDETHQANAAILQHLPNLRHLKAFLVVAELKSVNRAAEQVHLSQPAVTQAIARLEQNFGVDLFTRHQTGMYLTPFGTLLQARLIQAFDALALGASQATTAALSKSVLADPVRFMTASQLDVLVTLLHTHDLNAASAALRISVASLHRNMRSLEQQLGTKLVSRDGQNVRFTRAGAILAQQGKLAMRAIELAREDIDWAQGVNGGRLTIGALPLARTYIAPKAMVTVATRHPNLRVRLMEGSYAVLLQALREGDIDLLIGALRQPAPAPDVIEAELFTEELCVVARSGHPLAQQPKTALVDMLKYPWVAPRAESPARQQFDHMMRDAKAKPPLLLEVASHIAVRAILFESDTLALLSREQIRYEEQNGQLIVLPVQWQKLPRAIGYTVRANWRPTQAQTELVQALKDICADR